MKWIGFEHIRGASGTCQVMVPENEILFLSEVTSADVMRGQYEVATVIYLKNGRQFESTDSLLYFWKHLNQENQS